MKNEMNSTTVDGMLIPKRVKFETFYGCNARCTMCAISKPATRKIGEMTMEMFTSVVDSLVPYKDHIEKVDLFGLGEPMLDSLLFERIKYLKDRGFKGLGISTNAQLLSKNKQKLLLESGMETVIFSIDGFTKESHEAIRIRTNFDQVVENCLSMIRMRNEGNYVTRFVVRLIRQWGNGDEWADFLEFWQSKLDGSKNDLVIRYDVNGMGGEMYSREELMDKNDVDPEIERMPCHLVFDRLIVLADGTIPLCDEDTPRANFNFGNVSDSDALGIWNRQRFSKIRDLHSAGEKNQIDLCAQCTVLYCESKSKVHIPN